jgi:hypothetical protein
MPMRSKGLTLFLAGMAFCLPSFSQSIPNGETSYTSSNPMPSDSRYFLDAGSLYYGVLGPSLTQPNFNGQIVFEASGGTGNSTCTLTGAQGNTNAIAYNANPQVSGGAWTVAGPAVPTAQVPKPIGNYSGQNDTYGDDGVWIPTSWINYYQYNSGGCTITIHQTMVMDCTDGQACAYA